VGAMRVRARESQAEADLDAEADIKEVRAEARDVEEVRAETSPPASGDARAADLLLQLARLSRLTAPLEGPATTGTAVSSGFRALDRLLPAGGICRGSLVEWIGGPASGATALAFAVACRLVAARRAEAGGRGGPPARGGTIIVVDRRGRFHPPAVLPWVEASQGGPSTPLPSPAHDTPPGALVVVRPARDEDEIWAIDQALRCPGVTAVVAWPQHATSTVLRRWQVGARSGGAVGLLLRPPRTRRDPSWAQARLAVTALPSTESRGAAPLGPGSLPRPADAVLRPAGAVLRPAGAQATSGVRLVPSLAVRRLRISLVEGPWACAVLPEACGVEIALDLATGREAFAAGGEALPDRRAASGDGTGVGHGPTVSIVPEGERVPRGVGRVVRPDSRSSPGGVSCRAS